MSGTENIHSGHRKRLKEEFLGCSAELDSFSDVRALELLLFYAVPQKDMNPLAHSLLNEFGSLYNVLSAPVEQLKAVDGAGENVAILLRLVSEINKKSILEKQNEKKKTISSSSEAGEFFQAFYLNCLEEMFLMMCLDSQHCVIKTEIINRGNVNSVSVDRRKIAQLALQNGATSVIFSHNHPDGNPSPSREDMDLTASLKSALENIGIVVDDHIIIGNGSFFSFAGENLI